MVVGYYKHFVFVIDDNSNVLIALGSTSALQHFWVNLPLN